MKKGVGSTAVVAGMVALVLLTLNTAQSTGLLVVGLVFATLALFLGILARQLDQKEKGLYAIALGLLSYLFPFLLMIFF